MKKKILPQQPVELSEDHLDKVSAGDSPATTSSVLSNVSKTRSEISATFARNARA